MKIDVTLEITPKMVQDAQGHDKKSLSGHLGTHFDVMNKEFPLEYTQRRGIVFDVSGIKDRDIGVFDVDLEKVPADSFVMFYSGFIEEEGYGSARYFKEHPQLSDEFGRSSYFIDRRGFCGDQARPRASCQGSVLC